MTASIEATLSAEIALTRSVQDGAKHPTLKEIDALILEHVAAQANLMTGGVVKQLPGESAAEIFTRAAVFLEAASLFRATASGTANEVKGRLLAMVQSYGVQHANKSQRLNGEHNQATVTTGTRTEVVAARVDELRGYLDKSKIPELSGRFFLQHISYSLVASPAEVLKTLKLGKRIREKIDTLLHLCFDSKATTPSLKIAAVEAVKP